MGPSIKDTEVGGRRCPDLGPLPLSHNTGHIYISRVDLCGEPRHQEVTGGFPSKGKFIYRGGRITSTIL